MSENKRRLQEIKRAVKKNDAESVRRLLAEDPHLVTASGQGWTPLQDAAFQGRQEILKLMLTYGPGITPGEIAHALHHAVQLPHADPEVVELLLQTGRFLNCSRLCIEGTKKQWRLASRQIPVSSIRRMPRGTRRC